MIERLSFLGLGKLGLPLAALFARSGLPTVAIDRDAELVARLKAGNYPDSEPGLVSLLHEAAPRMVFSTDAADASATQATIILVPTPSSDSEPEFSNRYLLAACRDVSRALAGERGDKHHSIIVSSTVFPGTIAEAVTPIFAKHSADHPGHRFEVAHVPDFVALGEVITGFRKPSYLLVGSDDPAAADRVTTLYRRIIHPDTPVRMMPIAEAEMTKLAHNVYSCLKISFGNLLLQMGDRMGGLHLELMTGALSLNPQIGPGLLRGGAPYGGPCFPRDIPAFLRLAERLGMKAPLADGAAAVNDAQYALIVDAVLKSAARRVCVLGLSFKHGTPYTIGSPGLALIRQLLDLNLTIAAFDPAPQARHDTALLFGSRIRCAETLEESWSGADTVLISTADPAFRGIADSVPASTCILDPWGIVAGSHPRLVRIGRPARSYEDGQENPPRAEGSSP